MAVFATLHLIIDVSVANKLEEEAKKRNMDSYVLMARLLEKASERIELLLPEIPEKK